MNLMTTALLAGAGVIAGIIATMVGGAAVVIYPALIATGVPPQLAAISNLASVMPATMLAALSDRSQLPPFDRAFRSSVRDLAPRCWCSRRSGRLRRSCRCYSASHVAIRLFRANQPLASRAPRGAAMPSRSTSPA